MEVKAKLDAAGLAATQRQKAEEASQVFFQNVEIALRNELNKANPELQKHGLLTGHRAGGIAMDQKRFETQIRLTYGRASSCEVNFDQAHLMVLVEMSFDIDAGGKTAPQKLAFRLGHSGLGTVARKVEPDEKLSGEFGPGQVAEIVISGLIRSHFE